jgi:hypothetical protein
MLIIGVSVLARIDEHFAQGAFCPELSNATDVPILPKGFAKDYLRVRTARRKLGRKVLLTLRHRHLLPRACRYCRAEWQDLPTFGMVKAAERLPLHRLPRLSRTRPKAICQWNSDRMICGA